MQCLLGWMNRSAWPQPDLPLYRAQFYADANRGVPPLYDLRLTASELVTFFEKEPGENPDRVRYAVNQVDGTHQPTYIEPLDCTPEELRLALKTRTVRKKAEEEKGASRKVIEQ